MKNKEVIKGFLNRNEESTRHLFCENYEFKDKIVSVLYSYGKHFPLAIMLSDRHIIINENGYSQTTSTHKGHLCRELGFKDFSDFCKNHNKADYSLMTTDEMSNLITEKKVTSYVELIEREI
jgi:hypothetical protein